MNGKDCLLAFADLGDAYIAAANETETIRGSFMRQKKRRTGMIGAVCGSIVVLFAAVAFGAGHWFRQTPSVAAPALPETTEPLSRHESLTQHELFTQHDLLTQQGDAAVSIPDTAPYVTPEPTEPAPGIVGPSTVVEPETAAENNETAFHMSYLYFLDDSAYASYIPGKVIPPDKVGEKIGDATATAGWKYADGTTPETEQLRCEIFRITDIDPSTAVCIRFIDKGEALTTDHYYVQINTLADTSAVSEYIIPQAEADIEE